MKRIAIYAGTFDFPTLGHLWMIEQSSKMFDEVIMAVGTNPEKENRSMFSVEERLDMMRKMTAHLNNVRIGQFTNEYLVNYAASVNANFIVRGIRSTKDYEEEKLMRNINEKLQPSITSIFLMPPKEVADISSSVVKGLIGPAGWEEAIAMYVPDVVFAKIINAKHTLWKNLIKNGAKGDEESFWLKLTTPYLDKKRGHHALHHITEMLCEFEEVKHLLHSPLTVEYSIWYHDLVYNTLIRNPQNEKRSAEIAKKDAATLDLSETFGEMVYKLIMATRHDNVPPNSDAKYLVDIDMAVLGSSESVFNKYEQGIRKDYEHVPWDTYAHVRADILQKFLDQEHIYVTEHFRKKYEVTARKNLERAIKDLKR